VTESYRCWAEVDLNALRANLVQIRNRAGSHRRILTVVKADAYGHGLRQIAAVLMQSGTDIFGVANLAEARAIRMVGEGWPILMLGACLPTEIEWAVRESIMPTVSTLEEARRFSDAAARLAQDVLIHLKVDTGMGRLGVLPAEALPLIEQIEQLPRVHIRGIYTHYSSVEDDPEFTRAQRDQFVQLISKLTNRGCRFEWVHASSSGGLLLEEDPGCNVVRAGLLVYGVVPSGKRVDPASAGASFQPALSWKCRVTLVRDVPQGTPISYGHTYVTPHPARIATISVGYGDGYFRSASNRASVLIHGKRCGVVGRVTMDQTVVDVSGLGLVQPGDEVLLLGEQGPERITANELAEWSQTIPWEVLTNITYRVPRVYRGSHAA
jgi:alanine racemase